MRKTATIKVYYINIKKTKLLLVTALFFTATGAFAMADMFKNGVLHFDYKAEELAPAEAAARLKLEKDLQYYTGR